MPDSPATAAVIGAELIVFVAAVGAAAGLLWILPPEQPAEHPRLVTARRTLWRLLGLSLILFIIAGVPELLLRTASMSGLPLDEAYRQLDTVLLKTHYGRFWLWRYGALMVAVLAWGYALRPERSRALTRVALAALAAVTITLSTAGHAGDDGFLTAANFANTLHILGGLLWGGGILVTMAILLPRLTRGDAPRELPATVSLRLSTLAAVALALVIIPGVYNAWLLVGSWQGLWATAYGQTLVAKLLLVAVMAGLGALNRYRYVPALQRHAGLPEPPILLPLPAFLRGDDTAPAAAFLTSLRLEGALLLGVLLLAAVLSQQVPAVHAEHQGMEEHAHGDH